MSFIKDNRIKGLLIALLMIFTTACDDFLDTTPESAITNEQFWGSNADAELGVAAIYDAMQKHYRTRFFTWGEMRSDNFVATDRVSGDAQEILSNSISGNNGAARWNIMYRMIGNANLAIENIPGISGFDEGLLAEAYALRAFAYFDAVRAFGAVPLFTEGILGLDQEIARQPTDGQTIINDVIIPDMLRAEELMRQPANLYRFSLGSIYALQADVYMFQQDYALAKEALDKIVALGEYELADDLEEWALMFLSDLDLGKFQTGPELIFSIGYNILEDNESGGNSGNYATLFAGIPSYWISSLVENKWIDKFPLDSASWYARYPATDPPAIDPLLVGQAPDTELVGDFRYYWSREDRAIGEARVAKYAKANYLANDDQTDHLVYRYSDMLLKLAECENQLGNDEVALDLVNQIRTARQLPLVTATEFGATAVEREDFILDERQLELLGEGKRWWDLLRTGKAIEIMGPINGQTQETLFWPYFDRAVIDNPNLTND